MLLLLLLMNICAKIKQKINILERIFVAVIVVWFEVTQQKKNQNKHHCFWISSWIFLSKKIMKWIAKVKTWQKNWLTMKEFWILETKTKKPDKISKEFFLFCFVFSNSIRTEIRTFSKKNSNVSECSIHKWRLSMMFETKKLLVFFVWWNNFFVTKNMQFIFGRWMEKLDSKQKQTSKKTHNMDCTDLLFCKNKIFSGRNCWRERMFRETEEKQKNIWEN